MDKYAAVRHSLGGDDQKPKKEIEHVKVRKAANGGHIIEHHHTHPEHHPMEEHTTKSDDEMAEHMLASMGTPNTGEAEADAGTPDAASATAGAAAPSPMGSGAASAPAAGA
jgi:hypothetical protein